LLGVLLGKSYREQSILIAESSLLQRFCMVARIDNKLKVLTKSTLQRFPQFFDESFIRDQVTLLNKFAFDPSNFFGLCDPLEAKHILKRLNKMTKLLPEAIAQAHTRIITGGRIENTDKLLVKKGIYNGLCPRNPLEFAERMQEKKFNKLQKRRGQTEGRIGIVKNTILDGSLYERQIEGKQLKIGWAILVHNLWCLARMPVMEEDLAQVA